MILPVVLLPDTALLVPGAAGRADPLAGLRDAAVPALSGAWAEASERAVGRPEPGDGGDRAGGDPARPRVPAVLVIAPGTRDRDLHGARGSLTAAGVPAGIVPEVGPADGPRADVPASVALHLLHAAGVPLDDVRVVEVARSGAAARAPLADSGLPGVLVVVGSLSARDGADAPLAADPDAPGLDDALVTALGTGPATLATVLDGAADLSALAVSGAGPWRTAIALLTGRDLPADPTDADGARVLASTTGTALGAHVVARWSIPIPATTPAPTTNPQEPR